MRNLSRRKFLSLTALAASASLIAAPAWSQGYPSKPIRLVVPLSPGGSLDVVGRYVGAKLSEALGQPVIIENKPGASGTIAASTVVRSAPDGYTVLFTISALLQTPALLGKLAYDPGTDLIPVTDMFSAPLWLVVSDATVSSKTLKNFAHEVKAHPKKYSYASVGNGSISHLLGTRLNDAAGLDLLHVPYKGAAPISFAVTTGEVSAAFLDFGTSKPLLTSGKLRALAVTGAQRSPLTPNVPTFAEEGYAGFDVPIGGGLFVPKKTPPEIIQKLHSSIARILQQPDIVARFHELGYLPGGQKPEQYGAQLKLDNENWASIIRKAGITAE